MKTLKGCLYRRLAKKQTYLRYLYWFSKTKVLWNQIRQIEIDSSILVISYFHNPFNFLALWISFAYIIKNVIFFTCLFSKLRWHRCHIQLANPIYNKLFLFFVNLLHYLNGHSPKVSFILSSKPFTILGETISLLLFVYFCGQSILRNHFYKT